MLAYDYHREAYILRGVGGRYGPVLRPDRRQAGDDGYSGPERRSRAAAHPPGPSATAFRGRGHDAGARRR
jgi:hypothetical protein